MARKLDTSELTMVIGPSGGGKTVLAEIIKKTYKELGIDAEILSAGKLISQTDSLNTPISKKLIEMYNKCELHPGIVATHLIFDKMLKCKDENKYYITEGIPRQAGQYIAFKQLVDAGILKSILVIEIFSSHSLCEKRLIERTRIDERLDLSVDGKPGTPDLNKIRLKLLPWETNRYIVESEIDRYNGLREKIYNHEDQTVQGLEQEIRAMFI